jgi:hypothetical protein
MQKPSFGETNLGALVGAVVGSVGGLFAVGIAPAIVGKSLALLFATPILSLASWIVSGCVGWVIGGQLGPRLGALFRTSRGEIVGGVVGGLIPVVSIALWGWYMVMPH